MSFGGGYHQSTGGMNVGSDVASIAHQRSRVKAGAGPAGVAVGIDFPLVCEICLGDNPYVRMIKMPNGAQCKISERPYTMFKWRAGRGGRYKTTIICYEVAKAKNVCQACLSDMEYGLPVAVRDKVLAQALKDGGEGATEALAIPESQVGQAYYFNQIAAQQSQDAATGRLVPYGQLDAGSSAYGRAASNKLLKLARRIHNQPYGGGGPGGAGGGGGPSRLGGSAAGRSARGGTAFRNLPKMCSFWVAGTCMRVGLGSCPFRPCCGVFKFPELAGSNRDLNAKLIAALNKDGPAAVMKNMSADDRAAIKESQKGSKIDSIRARYYGVDDALATKYMGRLTDGSGKRGGRGGGKLEPPADDTVTTLWVGGVVEHLGERDLRAAFQAHGEIVGVRVVRASSCALVEFATHASAAAAIGAMRADCNVRGAALSLNWAKRRAPDGGGAGRGSGGAPGGARAVVPASSLPIPGAPAAVRPSVNAAFLAGVANAAALPAPGAATSATPPPAATSVPTVALPPSAAAAASAPAVAAAPAPAAAVRPPVRRATRPQMPSAIPLRYPSQNPNFGRR